MSDQEQINALKAQVNYLREGLSLALLKVVDSDEDITYDDVLGYLLKSKEQCLAEVKANAIEEYKQSNTPKPVNGLSVDTWKRMFRVC